MSSLIVVKYSRYRAFFAASIPLFTISGLMFDFVNHGSFYKYTMSGKYLGTSMIVVGVVWWVYAVGVDAIRILLGKFDRIERDTDSIRLTSGILIPISKIESVEISKRLLKKKVVIVNCNSNRFRIETLFQEVLNYKDENQISRELLGEL